MSTTAGGSGSSKLPAGDDRLDDDHCSGGISRRSLMRRSMIAGTAVAVGSSVVPRYSPVGRANAINWDRAKDAAAIAAGAVVAGPLGAGAVAYYLGDENNYEHYTGGDALRTQIHQGNLRMKDSIEQVMSALENNIRFVENVFVPKGMAAVAEALNDEKTQAEAEEELAKVLDEHTAGIQEDVLKNFESNISQYAHYVDRLDDHDDAAPENLLWAFDDDWEAYEDNDEFSPIYNPYAIDEWMSTEVELADDSVIEIDIPAFQQSNTSLSRIAHFPEFISQNSSGLSHSKSGEVLGFFSTEDGEVVEDDDDIDEDNITINANRYDEALDSLAVSRGDAYGELSSFVSDAYTHYEPGEIDLGDVVDPTTAYLEFSNEIDDEAFAGAMASSMLGIPRTEEPMNIVLEDDGIEVEGSIYSTESPEGGFDTTGSTTYNPETLEFAVMLRYTAVMENNNEEEAESRFTEIDQPFTILDATDGDGNEVDTVAPEPSVEWDPAEVESIQEQLEQIQEEQIRMQNESQDDGESWLPSIPGLGTGASTVLYILLALTGFGLFVLFVLVAIAMITR